MNALNLHLFDQLLSPNDIAPIEQFPEEPSLIFSTLPQIETRAKIRFLLGSQIRFQSGHQEKVQRLIKHWRAKLAPQL